MKFMKLKLTWKRVLMTLLAAALLVCCAHLVLILPWMNGWGASEAEVAQSLPGDEIVHEPSIISNRAVTIQAKPSDIWPWIVQIGQGRGGFYSYEWLENLFGCDIHNADSIMPEHQSLSVGDGIKLHLDTPPVPVIAIEKERHLVLGAKMDPRNGHVVPLDSPSSEQHIIVSWVFVLQPRKTGETRLIARFRAAAPRGILYWLGYRFLLEPVTFIMERKMLLGIRDRAERE